MTSENNTPKRYLASETTLHLKQSIVCLRFDMQPLNGIIYETHENGKLNMERYYKGGKEVSFRYWHENGQLREEGKRNHIAQWYDNGQLKFSAKFWTEDDYNEPTYGHTMFQCEEFYDKDGKIMPRSEWKKKLGGLRLIHD